MCTKRCSIRWNQVLVKMLIDPGKIEAYKLKLVAFLNRGTE